MKKPQVAVAKLIWVMKLQTTRKLFVERKLTAAAAQDSHHHHPLRMHLLRLLHVKMGENFPQS